MSKDVESNSQQVDTFKPVDRDSSNNFFNNLENSVNGMIQGEENQSNANMVTPAQSGPQKATQNFKPAAPKKATKKANWRKRYNDSSREAGKLHQQLSELKPFVPVLEAMKRDSGLVEHVRDYLKSGGSPAKTVQQKLGLKDDFIYDANEAVADPDSDSAKVQRAHIDELVSARVGNILTREKQNSQRMNAQMIQKKQEVDFIKKHKMSKSQYESFKKAAQNRRLTLDDIHYILNRDKQNKNVANSTKKDMMAQMKNVRNIPTTASDSNNQGSSQKNPEDNVFDALMGTENVDTLFG